MADVRPPPADIAEILHELGIAPEIVDRLAIYVAMLERWTKRINLIGRGASSDEIWRRHVLDCVQLWPHLDDPTAPMLDLGSGGGLPGLLLAMLGASDITLIDSDRRKCVFLQEAARATGVKAHIVAQRFEPAIAEMGRRFHIVTGRAVAPLPRIAPILESALAEQGYALLHKGAQVEKELTEMSKSWSMTHALIPSITASEGVLVKIWGLQRYDART